MVKTNFKGFNTKESPFHEEYGGRKEQISVRMENDAIQFLIKHLEEVYGKDGKSIGIRQILYDYLDKLCLNKRIFNHLEAVMLLPKTDDLDDLESQSQIIAIINTKSDFLMNFNHIRGFGEDMDAIYEMSDFNEVNFHYVLEMFKNTIDSCVYMTSKEDFESFESFKQKQAEIYPDLDLDDCYFVRFPLNNLMDNANQGKSVHYKSWKNNHLGGFILADALHDRFNFLLIDWYFLSEISSEIRVDFQFVQENYLTETLMMDSYYFDVKVNNSFYMDDKTVFYAFSPYFDKNYRENQLKELKNKLISQLEFIDKMLNFEEEID